ncbi:hypothetical protein [Azospira sp. I09]|jgi:hypothetical protein|uniref:hypothetical protein n=1 Tax=Azospira sp. I09 TaxID=1765049 RepID=UPI0012604A49|nr:hypothetical protein [Azospira sp. I09]BBN90115.1 hypothetical protein AZSP09_31380 [Azospira sp. I09]
MPVARITADYAGDPNVPADEKWKLVFDAVIESERVKQQHCFGVCTNLEAGSIKRWPFILRPAAKGSTEWIFDYGTDSGYPPEVTNITERDIRIGSYFTVGTGPEAGTYRITQIDNL